MRFFDDAHGTDPTPAPELQPLYARPRGFSPQEPRDWVIPTVLPLGRRLAESTTAVVALDAVYCWPDGVGLPMRALMRHPLDIAAFPRSADRVRHGGLHLGVAFSDGRRAVHLDGGSRSSGRILRGGEISSPVMSVGSAWTQFHRRLEVYLTPVPPAGPLTIVVQWAEQGITETWVDLDGDAVRTACAAVEDVWPDLPVAPSPTRGQITVRVGGSSTPAGLAGLGRVEPSESDEDLRPDR